MEPVLQILWVVMIVATYGASAGFYVADPRVKSYGGSKMLPASVLRDEAIKNEPKTRQFVGFYSAIASLAISAILAPILQARLPDPVSGWVWQMVTASLVGIIISLFLIVRWLRIR